MAAPSGNPCTGRAAVLTQPGMDSGRGGGGVTRVLNDLVQMYSADVVRHMGCDPGSCFDRNNNHKTQDKRAKEEQQVMHGRSVDSCMYQREVSVKPLLSVHACMQAGEPRVGGHPHVLPCMWWLQHKPGRFFLWAARLV